MMHIAIGLIIIFRYSTSLSMQVQTTYTTGEILAQAMCQASAPYGAIVYAVGRKCSLPRTTCHHICSNRQLGNQDGQITNSHRIVDCIASYHLYTGRPSTNKNGDEYTATLGLKSVEGGCHHAGCGPNYCCCMARNL